MEGDVEGELAWWGLNPADVESGGEQLLGSNVHAGVEVAGLVL